MFQKLVPNFFDKEKYVLHYENMQVYLRLGFKLKDKSLNILRRKRAFKSE